MEKFLRSKSPLLRGTTISWQRPSKPPQEWHFPGGITQYLDEQTGGGTAWSEGDGTPDEQYWLENGWIAPPLGGEFFHATDTDAFRAGEGFELVCGWRDGVSTRESYVNLIPTKDGGRHETGLRAGLLEAMRKAGDRLNMIPKGIKIEGDDIWSGLSFVLSIKLRDPHFQGQTKDRLNSKEAHTLVQGMAQDAMELWLNDHPTHAKSLLESIIQAAVRRSKSSVKTERKRTYGATVLPGKLTDCLERDVARTELFIVEGDSAGGSGKMGRDKDCQAILPIRGKILNTWEVDSHKAMESDTVNDISTAIGVDPHPGRIDDVDLSRLRYGKIFIMADADVDGSHIQTLLLTLFYRHFPALVAKGHIWIARAPLYRVDAPAKKGEKAPRKIYALNEEELDAIRLSLGKEGLPEEKIVVSRFKGLGEMNPEQLWETTMNPDSRRPVKIKMPDTGDADEAFNLMMAKKNTNLRKDWIEQEGHLAQTDI
jgi:topoisomerase-4 subunit B